MRQPWVGGVHLVSPDVGGSEACSPPARPLAPTAQARVVIATHNTTPGTVQMAPMATATVAGCGLVMPGRPAHGSLLPPHMNRAGLHRHGDRRHGRPVTPRGGGARRGHA